MNRSCNAAFVLSVARLLALAAFIACGCRSSGTETGELLLGRRGSAERKLAAQDVEDEPLLIDEFEAIEVPSAPAERLVAQPQSYPIARVFHAERWVPSNDRNWAPEHERIPTAEFLSEGQIHVRNVRNADWLTDTDCIPSFYDKTVDLNDLQTVDFIVVPFNNNRAIAHTMLSFGFGKGEYIGLSVEVRKEQGEMYGTATGLMRQFELTYVLADERDLLPVRVHQRASDVYIYRAVAPPERVRALFGDVLQRANQLAESPEFYDTITNNCTTNLVRHVNKLHPGRIPNDVRALLPGYSDRLAYDLGLIDNRLSFEETKCRAHSNDRIVRYEGAADFSAKIRR